MIFKNEKLWIGLVYIIVAAVLQPFLPWWIIGILGFFFGLLFRGKDVHSFLTGFVAMFLLWLVLIYFIDNSNESVLSSRMANLFGGLLPFALILLSALVSGLAGGLSMLAGSSLRKAIK